MTFLFSNLIGLKQTNVQRMLGYSSIAQMGLLMLALALLQRLGATASLPLVVGGLFFNHLFAKAGLFWLAGAVERTEVGGWSAIAGRPLVLLVLALLLVAIAGLPPFPGFWAKWELVMQLSGGEAVPGWIGVILVGSLLEAAYMFGWFKQATRSTATEPAVDLDFVRMLPPVVCAALLAVGGYLAASMAGAASLWLFAPLCVGVLLYALDWLPGRVKCTLMLVAVLGVGTWMIADVGGISRLFAVLLLAGGLVVASAALLSRRARPGYYPLMAVMLLSIAGAAARRDQPGILLLLGTDHALVLFHDRARAQRSSPCAALPAVFARLGLLPACGLRACRRGQRHRVARRLRRPAAPTRRTPLPFWRSAS